MATAWVAVFCAPPYQVIERVVDAVLPDLAQKVMRSGGDRTVQGDWSGGPARLTRQWCRNRIDLGGWAGAGRCGSVMLMYCNYVPELQGATGGSAIPSHRSTIPWTCGPYSASRPSTPGGRPAHRRVLGGGQVVHRFGIGKSCKVGGRTNISSEWVTFRYSWSPGMLSVT